MVIVLLALSVDMDAAHRLPSCVNDDASDRGSESSMSIASFGPP
jgi:hypothetical protein